MNTVIPNNYVGISNYIARSDYVFNQGFNEYTYENNRLSEIKSNSIVYCWSGFLPIIFNYLIQKYEEIKAKIWRYDLLDVDNFFDYFGIKKSNKHIKFQELVASINGGCTTDYKKNILYY